MLSIKNIELRRGGKALVKNFGHDFLPGKLTVIAGPNGAGKSTLLKIISGEWSADIGEVFWGEDNIRELKTDAMGRRRSFLHQETHLDFSFTVMEVVLLGRYPHGEGNETPEDFEIAREALDCFDMTDFAARDYTTLSGGEKQRVQLARSLAQVWDPLPGGCYWMLDEPVNNLDPAHQRAALKLMQKWAEKGATVITVLHDLNLVLEFGDEVILMKNGQLLASGEPGEVFTLENLKQAFDLEMEVVAVPGRKVPVVVARI